MLAIAPQRGHELPLRLQRLLQRVALVDSPAIVFNEGLTSPGLGGNYLSEIPYWVVLPKRKELVNLAAPNCPSSGRPGAY